MFSILLHEVEAFASTW